MTIDAVAQTSVQNSASIQPPAGQTDVNPGDNTDAVTVQVYAATVGKTGSPADGEPVAPGDTLGFTLTVTVSGATTTEPTVFTDTLSSGLTLVGGSLPAGCSGAGQTTQCTLPVGSAPGTYSWSYQATVDADASGTVSNTVTGGQGCTPAATCTVTHPVYFSLLLTKLWVNGQDGNAVDLDISGSADEVIVLQTGNSTVGGASVAGRAAVAPGAAVSVAETFTSGTAGNYSTVLACARADNGAAVPAPGGTLSMPTNTGVNCSFTNTRQAATLQLVKTWVNALAGETATVTSTGFTNEATTGLSTSTGNNSTTGAAVTVYAGDSGTLSEVLSNAGNYTATLACTGNATPLSGNTLTVTAGDTAIVCTQTNTRQQATLVLSKTWVDGLPGDTATVTSSGFENTASSGLSTSTGGNTTTGSPVTVYAGETGTISETLSNPGNYDSTLACTGNSTPLAGNQLSVAPGDAAISCTQTNTRRAVNLTLRKTWVDAAIGETVQFSATGSTTSPIALTSVADSASETDTGTPVQVYAGENLTLAETFAVPGNAANYNSTLACTGTAGLTGSTLLVGQGDTDIVCTYTNTRPQATLQLVKVWAANSRNGDVAQLAATTGLQNNTNAFTSTASVQANSTTVPVFIGEQALLPAETMSGSALANYSVALTCNGGSLGGSDGKAANTLDITPADTGNPIVCTYTNTRSSTTLTLQKTWLNGFANDEVTIVATGLASLDSVANGSASQTDTGPAQTVYAGDVISLTESFRSVTSNLYATTLSCTNTSGLVINDPTTGTLTVGPTDGPMTCTYVNDRRSAQLVVRKVWSGGPPTTVSIPPSTGFTNNTPGFTSTSPGPDQVGPVTVYAFENGNLGAESFPGGNGGDYSSSLSCDGTDTNPADGLLIAVADADTTITCTYSNTFVPRSSLDVSKITPVQSVTTVGQNIPYTITVNNTGNVPLTNVTVADPLIAGNMVCTPAIPVATLAVGGSISCTGSYTVTQADIDRVGSGDGSDDDVITNTVNAGGTDPDGNTVVDNASTDTTLPPRNYVAEFTKTPSLADSNGNGTGSVGEVISYNFTVTNAGNTTIQSVTIADPMLPGLSCPPGGPLAPGESLTFGTSPPADIACTGNTYTITQADIDDRGGGDGDIDNTATGTAVAPGGGSTTGDATASVPVDPPAPQLAMDKSASPSQVSAAGDVITYTFLVTNPGNVTIDNISVTDPKAGLSAITCLPAAPFSLAPGGSASCTATYTVTQADIDGSNAVVNVANAAGDYDGTPVDDSDGATVIINHGTVQPEFVKTADRIAVTATGEVITYSFRVDNPSTATLQNLQIIDDTLLGSGLSCDVIPTLPPNSSVNFSCTGDTYTVQQSDIDNQGNPVNDSRVIHNDVTGQAEYQIGTNPVVTVTATASADVSLPQRTPAIFFSKSSDVASVSGPGQPITYSFSAQNTGNVTLFNVTVTDPLLPGLVCLPLSSLGPGDTVVFSGCTGNVYTVTQADIDSGSSDSLPGNGQIDNVATVVADTPVAGATVTDTAEHQVNLPVRGPQMTLVKSADVATITAPGTINYQFTVSNTGNVTLEDVTVTDPALGLSCPSVDMAPGQVLVFGGAGTGAGVVCTGTARTVTQAEVDTFNVISNVANANGTSQVAGAISRTGALDIPVVRSPALSLSKTADVAQVNAPGDAILYTLVASNSGNSTLTNVTVSDPMLPALTCTPTLPVAALAPGEDIRCEGTYITTQADFDTNGGGDQAIDNTATASSDTASNTASARVGLPLPNQSLSIDKVAGTPTVALGRDPAVTDAGDTVTYTFTVTNTGNQSLSALAVIDTHLDAAATCDRTTLTATGPDSVATCTGVYTITQADMDNGTVTNTATAEGTPPGSARVSSSPDSAVVNLQALPVLVLDKSAAAPTVSGGALPGLTDAGDTISYSFVVTNNGNVTLNNITVGDPLPGMPPITCPPGQLAPGASTTCSTVVYTITQADLDAGQVVNTATGQGTPPSGPNATGDDSTTTPLAASPAMTMLKTASPTEYFIVGQQISYSYLVTNTGNVSLSALTLTDDRIASVSCPATLLAPGASTTCTATYLITQADLDAGSVTNTATATATPAQGTLAPVTAQATIDGIQTRSIPLLKTTSTPSYSTVGDPLIYGYQVTNTGNVTLTDQVSIVDDKILAPNVVNCPALPPGGLAPGADIVCTATYIVTQADLDAGSVTNIAVARAGTLLSPTDTVTINAVQAPGLSLDKTTSTASYDAVGDILAYSYLVTNTGNVTLTAPVTVTDDRITAPNTVVCPALPAGGLAPGGQLTCTATYTITQADLDAGSVTNTATAQSGTTTSGPDSVTVTGVQNPALSMAKAATNVPTPTVLGSVITYDVTGTNTGNTTLGNVVISDPKLTPNSTTCASVAPGGTCVLTGIYTVTQPDVDAGQVENIGSGDSDSTDPVPSNPVIVPVQQTRGLTLDKSSSTATYTAVGDLLAYSYLVTNSGTVTITAPITVTDDRITAPNTVSCPALPPGGLAPNGQLTCTGSYVVTQADLNQGSVTNIATATDGTSTSPQDSVTINATQLPAITLDKTASVADSNSDGITGDAGDVITYAFSVTNTGNVLLAPVTVSDPLLPGLTCTVLALPPGATASCTASNNTYVITFADETATTVNNTATATGNAPGTAPDATATDSVTTPTALTPAAITVNKVSAPVTTTQVAPGDVVQFTVTTTVANNETHEVVTLTDTLSDGYTLVAVTNAGAYTCNTANPLVCTLPVGTAPGSYPLVYTASVDADATGTLRNAVVPTKPAGVDPDPVCQSCSTEHPVVPSTATVTKAADPVSGSFVQRGQTITYTVTTVIAGSVTTQPLLLSDTLDAGLGQATVVTAGAYSCSANLLCVLPAGTLPGTYPLVYQVTVAADANGTQRNVITAGNLPGGDPDPTCVSCSTEHIVEQPALETTKVLSANSNASGEVTTGATLTYTVRATNTGNTTLVNLTIDDALITPGRAVCASVAPGGSCELTGTYVVTQADTDAGTVDNTADITAEPSAGGAPLPPAVCPAGSADARCHPVLNLPIARRPTLATTKTATLSVDRGTPGKGNIDDVITYAVDVTNTGNVTLDQLVVTDTFQGGATTTLDCAPTQLAPAQSATCAPYDHTITEAEAGVDGGTLTNRVLATAQPTGAGLASATATAAAVVEVENEPASIRLTKVAGAREVKIGDLVRYTLTAENVGDIDLVDGYLIDTPPAGFTYVEGSLQGDDDDHHVTASGISPLRINDLDIAAGNTARISYLMRVGAGVRPGTQINRAQTYAPTDLPASNVATAELVLGNDPLLDDSLIAGTVFDDRDGDSWQDPAELTGLRVQGGFAADAYVPGSTQVDRGNGPQPVADASAPLLHGLALGTLSGRRSEAEPPPQIVIRQRLREPRFTDDFVLDNRQGVRVHLDAQGGTRIERSGDAAKGLTAAAPRVQRTVSPGEGGYVVDYVIANDGIDEAGIPGVRIGSVEGLLMETDQFGRYHVVGVSGGGQARGRNYVLKVDAATLPEGSTFITRNPQLRRVTPGVPTRFDFAVQLPATVLEEKREVEMVLGEVFFAPDSAQIAERYRPVIEQMAAQVRQHGESEVIVSANGGSEVIAYERANAVREALLKALDGGAAQVSVVARADVDDPASLLVGVNQGGSLVGTVLFDTDSAVIRPAMQPLLARIAQDLEQRGGGRLVIVGHADVRGAVPYNQALGMRRAEAVYAALREQLSPAVRDKVRVDASADPAAPLDARPTRGEGR